MKTTRRGFFGSVAGALVAAKAPQVTIGGETTGGEPPAATIQWEYDPSTNSILRHVLRELPNEIRRVGLG